MKQIRSRISRNKYSIMNKKIQQKGVFLEWWDGAENLGDSLAPIIFQWMLKRRNINMEDLKKNSIKHLLTVGSLIGGSNFDAIVWGSGVMDLRNLVKLVNYSKYVKYDIRAVRGPLTKELLSRVGYDVSKAVLGDPGVLLPLIYDPDDMEKKYDCTVIYHHMDNNDKFIHDYNYLDIKTTDYVQFVNEIVSSKLVVSASLHGIIIAEAYGIPAVFLNIGVTDQTLKYIDWYYSTERYNVKMAKTIEEAIQIRPMSLPNLKTMQDNLLNSFPYDIL